MNATPQNANERAAFKGHADEQRRQHRNTEPRTAASWSNVMSLETNEPWTEIFRLPPSANTFAAARRA